MSTVSIQKELDAFKAAVVERNGFAANDIMTMRTALSVTLCGARGKYAAKINQRFVATEERLNGAPVFVGVDDSSQCLCIAAEGRWCVQPVEEKGQNSGCAYVKDKSSPLDPAVQWEVACGQNAYIDIGCGRVEQVRSSFQTFQEQSVSTQQDIRTALSVTLCGASGEYAAKINQRFVATEESVNGAPVFAGVDDSSQCLCIAADGRWYVQPVEEKGKNRGYAYIKYKASPLDPAVQWEVAFSQGDWQNQTFQEQSVSTQQDIRDAASVTLCGAIREYADKINQQFVATEERLNGAPVFVGVDDSSQCLSIAADGNWCVQSVEEKGQNRGCATVNDEGAAMS